MHNRVALGVLLTGLMLFPGVVQADMVNAGFETGDLTGWERVGGGSGAFSVVTSLTGVTRSYSAPYGSYFAVVHTTTNTTWMSELHQKVTLGAGQVLSGKAAMEAASDAEFYYLAEVKIFDSTTQAFPWRFDFGSVPVNTSMDWSTWEWTAPYDGTFQLEYRVMVLHAAGPGFINGLFDMSEGPSPVIPEPGTLTLLALGLPGLALLRRRRRAQ